MASQVEQTVNEIIADLKSRKGIGDEWEQIDQELQEEIRSTWVDLIEEMIDAIDLERQ